MSSYDDLEQYPTRHTYVRLTVIALWENLPLMLLASGLFSLLCAPAALLALLGLLGPALVVGTLTVAPAWAALLALEASVLRGIHIHIGVMVWAFRRTWTRSVALGLLVLIPLLAGLFTLSILALPEVPLVVWLGLAADGLGLLLLASLYLYAFPLLVLYDAGVYPSLRNALILASRYWINTLGLLSLGVLSGLSVLYLSSGLLFFMPAVWGIFIVNNCRMVMYEETGVTS